MSEDEGLSLEQDNRPGVLDPVGTAPSPSAPAAVASAADRARAELDAIDQDARSARPTHPANVASHPRHLAALEAKLHLRRVLLGTQNAVRDIYFEPGDTGVLPDVPTETLTITREDLPRLAPGSWSTGETARVMAAADTLGVLPLELVRAFNITASAPPPPGKEIADLGELWGTDEAETDRNIALINGVLSRLRAVDVDLYARILPFAQRHPAMVNALLAFAKRRVGDAPRSTPTPRPTPAAVEPADRAEARWPFIWIDEVRR